MKSFKIFVSDFDPHSKNYRLLIAGGTPTSWEDAVLPFFNNTFKNKIYTHGRHLRKKSNNKKKHLFKINNPYFLCKSYLYSELANYSATAQSNCTYPVDSTNEATGNRLHWHSDTLPEYDPPGSRLPVSYRRLLSNGNGTQSLPSVEHGTCDDDCDDCWRTPLDGDGVDDTGGNSGDDDDSLFEFFSVRWWLRWRMKRRRPRRTMMSRWWRQQKRMWSCRGRCRPCDGGAALGDKYRVQTRSLRAISCENSLRFEQISMFWRARLELWY